MPFAYKKIIKQATEIVWTNKFLWIFGLFLVLNDSLNLFLNWLKENPEALQQFMNQPRVSAVTGGVILILLVFFVVLYFRSKAALIIGIKKLIDKKPAGVGELFKSSRVFFARILGISILTFLAMLTLVLVTGGPIAYLLSENLTARASILSGFGLIIFVPLAVIITLLGILATMFVVIFDLKMADAFTSSYKMLGEFWAQLLTFATLLFVVEVLALFVVGIFVLLGQLFYHREGFIAGSIVFFAIESVVICWQQTAWVLAFLELVKPQKFEDEEAVVIPEVV